MYTNQRTKAFALFLLLGLGYTSPGVAQIYQKTLPNGDVIFTDQAEEGAKKVELKPATVIPSINTDILDSPTTAKPKKTPAPKLSIESPAEGVTYRNAQADAIPLTISISPEPSLGSKVIVTLNGQAISYETANLPALDRGEQNLSVSVQSPQGKTLTSQSITFFVQRNSVLLNKPPANPYAASSAPVVESP